MIINVAKSHLFQKIWHLSSLCWVLNCGFFFFRWCGSEIVKKFAHVREIKIFDCDKAKFFESFTSLCYLTEFIYSFFFFVTSSLFFFLSTLHKMEEKKNEQVNCQRRQPLFLEKSNVLLVQKLTIKQHFSVSVF